MTPEQIDSYGRLLTNFCQYLPDDLYRYITILSMLTTAWGNRSELAVLSKNPGYAFYFLGYGSPIEKDQTENEWLDVIVRKAGLPPVDEISQIANAQIQGIKPSIGDKNLSERLEVILVAGKMNFSTLGIRGIRPQAILENSLILPPILFGDGEFVSLNDTGIDFKYYNESIHSAFWG